MFELLDEEELDEEELLGELSALTYKARAEPQFIIPRVLVC